MKRVFFLIAISYLVLNPVLTAEISDSAITQLYMDADMVLVCKVKKTEEIIIRESTPNSSTEVKSKKIKDKYKIETESILKSKGRAKAPKLIRTPEILIESVSLSFTSNVTKDTLANVINNGFSRTIKQ